MKPFYSFFAAAAMLFSCLQMLAQDPPLSSDFRFEPLDSWPYTNEVFSEGAVRTINGSFLDYALLNVHIPSGRLHYVQNGTIMQADMAKILTARIGDDVYINVMGKMQKVLEETEAGAISLLTSVDTEELNKVNIGYGVTSSTASTSSATLGLMDLNNLGFNITFSQAEEKKTTGAILPLKTELFFLVEGKVIPANKKAVIGICGKEDTKAFLKVNKVKWNKPATLVPVLDFLKSHITNE